MVKSKPLPPYQTLARLLEYNHETGVLTWAPRSIEWFDGPRAKNTMGVWNSRYAGQPAMTAMDSRGYLHGQLFKSSYRAHRIAFVLGSGRDVEMLNFDVDHINGIRTDNRFSNLRLCTRQENSINRAANTKLPNAKPGITNRNGKFRVVIGFDYGKLGVGTFETLAEAVAARTAAERVLGFHSNHGRRKPKM